MGITNNIGRSHHLTAAAVAFGAIACGVLGTPTAQAATLQQICQLDPGALDSAAIRGVYRAERRGYDRVHTCDLYDAASVHLGIQTDIEYGWYRKRAVTPQVAPAPAVGKYPKTRAEKSVGRRSRPRSYPVNAAIRSRPTKENTMTTTNSALRHRLIGAATLALGAGAVTIGALAGTPAAVASPMPVTATMEQSCVNTPGAYATGAVRGVYYTVRHGDDREQICKVYASTGKLLGTASKTDWGYYLTRPAAPVDPLPVQR
ncbi:MAG: hypothetical protein ACSLE3_10875 [Microbacteriaceae bacterium]